MNLKEKFLKEVVPRMMADFSLSSVMEVPRVEKIVINRGMGEALANPKAMDISGDEIAAITGQRPLITRAKKSVAAFKVRKGAPIGLKVTLRGQRMYDFLSKLINVAIPKIRDFKGVSKTSFDGFGNYTLGLKEQIIFPEIDYNKVDKIRGMDITIATTTQDDQKAYALLKYMGMPFRD